MTDLNNGLVLNLPLNEGSGTRVWDKSSKQNHGLGVNIAWILGRLGAKCVDFNGSTAYISIPDSASLRTGSSDWTRSIWINSDVPLIGTGVINDIVTIGTTTNKFLIRVNTDGSWALHYRSTGDGFTSVTISKKFQVDTMITATRAGTTLKIYQDGVVIAIASNAENEPDDSHIIDLATVIAHDEQFFDGRISSFKQWNRALSPEEIRTLYNAVI